MPRAYYNEFEPYCAAWLRELIKAGHIPDGDVDDRSIRDVRPADLRGYTQCHFFAGLGGWAYALRLAGWADDREVWTGSCPCQPFSAAGKRKGFADDRHLWPVWHGLIAKCAPSIIFGEQVASATQWLALVRSDLEAVGYAVGAMPVEAASAGSYHFRDRYWFVANPDELSPGQEWEQRSRQQRGASGDSQARPSGLAYGDGQRRQVGGYGDALGANGRQERRETVLGSGVGDLAHTSSQRREGRVDAGQQDRAEAGGSLPAGPSELLEFVTGADGKSRPVKPGIRLLAHGIPARVAKLRALGNAIDPRVAAEFIRAAAP